MNISACVGVRSGGRNEDRAACIDAEGRSVLVLADGAGGVGGGGAAAEKVVKAAKLLANGVFGTAQEALEFASDEISLLGSLSTGIIVEIEAGELRGASCGDSEAWLMYEGRVDELTTRQCRKPLLGGGGLPVSFGPTCLKGRLLIASDGLMKYGKRSDILRYACVEPLSAALEKLIELPRFSNGSYPDDVSVILARQV